MIYSSSFAKAHRKEFYRRLARVVRGGADDSLPSFGELQTRLHLFNKSYRGLQTIEVSKIVGTVDRTGDFGRDFLPRSSESRERWQRIERAFPTGGFPPISAYQVRDVYFVIDGNHRVALAKQRNAQFIDAEITEIHTDLDIDKDIDFERILYLEQARQFMEQSGLARARPTARIDFTRIQGFAQLLELVKVHGYDLMMQRGELLKPEDVAADWYDRVYTPAIESIRREKLAELKSESTDADLFLWVVERRRDLTPSRGDQPFDEAVRQVAGDGERRAKARGRRTRELK